MFFAFELNFTEKQFVMNLYPNDDTVGFIAQHRHEKVHDLALQAWLDKLDQERGRWAKVRF